MRSTLVFALKVWLSTIVFGSVFVITFLILSSPSEYTQWSFMPAFLLFTMLYSILLSLPTLSGFYVACYGLVYTSIKVLWIKTILICLGLAGCTLTLPFLIHHKSLINSSSLIFIACFGVPLIASTSFFKLRKPQSQ
ncbi:hypothetical protein FHT22_002751 [Pedobacter sp. SG918]|nr:hypothetical protein [Pedobacter sp. SG918]